MTTVLIISKRYVSPGSILENIGMAQKRLSEAAKKRLRAGRMLLAGKGCAEVALAVGVARQTVYTWKALLDEGGIDALRAVPERGRPAQLDQRNWRRCGQPSCKVPTEHGFGTELWTLKRVGAVIERMHGVRFGQTQVWRILGSLGFSPQKPEKRAIERNEDAVRSWKRSTWPALKKKPSEKAD
jgi:transposase